MPTRHDFGNPDGSCQLHQRSVKLDAVTIGSADWTEVGRLVYPFGVGSGVLLRIRGKVGSGAALTGLKLATAITPGGTLRDYLTDAELASPSAILPYSSTSPHTTAAGGSFELALDPRGLAEIVVYAKGAGASSVEIEAGH